MKTHAEVNYRKADGPKRCDACVMFRPPDSCTDVEKPIVPEGTCNIWAKAPMPDWVKQSDDAVVKLLAKSNVPVTRENYIALAYPDGPPEDWSQELEAQLPPQLQERRK